LDSDPTKVWTPQEVLAIAFQRPPLFPPGSSFDYSNTNYVLLGLIAEKVGGQPLATQFQERLFGPRGLLQTSLPAADDTSIAEPYSHGICTRVPADYGTIPVIWRAPHGPGHPPVDYTNQNLPDATVG
jgi:D-alanyl-D-alanine carboxypeptidase